MNIQLLAERLTRLGDAHDGVWNIFDGIGTPEQRIEVLDWYHLMENAHKGQGTAAQLSRIRALLWRGETRQVIRYLRQERCLWPSWASNLPLRYRDTIQGCPGLEQVFAKMRIAAHPPRTLALAAPS